MNYTVISMGAINFVEGFAVQIVAILICLRHILIKNEELKIKNCRYPSYNVETLRATSHCERVIGRGGDVARNVSTNTMCLGDVDIIQPHFYLIF